LKACRPLAALLPAPAGEGVWSDAFPGVLRKTEREIYRWPANTHYDHLVDALAVLEAALAGGCEFGELLATRSRRQFVALTAEVLVAEDLIHRGFTVTTVPRTNEPTPDLRIAGDELDLAVEVYTPRELLAFDTWVAEVRNLVDQADVAADYVSGIETSIDPATPPDQHPDSWKIDEMLERAHDEVLAAIGADVDAQLRQLSTLNHVYENPGTPLRTRVG